ncbi:MAG: Gldg family protein [Nitrospinae bacterium]|nr:Gldg family protein [Nitrospinota bacterium]
MKGLAPIAGWTALLLGFAALIAYLFLPELTLWSLTFAAVAGLNAVFFFVVDRQEVIRSLKTRTALHGMNATVVIFVFLGILVFINILTHRHKFRWDLTETSVYTLAPQTQKIAANLPRKVKMTAFYETGHPGRSEFERLVDGYKGLTDKIEIEFVDPIRQPAVTKQYGVTTYGTVVLESGKQETKIKLATEENLTNALLQVTRDQQKKIYFLSGHKEKNIEDKERNGYSQAKQALEQDHYKVEQLLLLQTGKVPDDANVLIINGPEKALQESEIAAVEAYLNTGGAVLLLLDPRQDSGLTPFLERWGVDIGDDLVVDPLAKLYSSDFTIPIVSPVDDHPITRNMGMQQAILPLLRSVSAITTEGLETKEILFSGARSWAEKDYQSGKVRLDPGIDLQGPVPVAVVSSKEIIPADRVEPNPDAPPDAQPSGPPASVNKAHLVVVGDSDFAGNQYFSLYGNGDFFLNAASWLAKEENLISIRPRKRKWSPITLTETQGNLTFILGIIVFPGLVILTGFRVWWKRRSL